VKDVLTEDMNIQNKKIKNSLILLKITHSPQNINIYAVSETEDVLRRPAVSL